MVELDFHKSISDGVNIYAKRDGDADFVFLACRAGVRRRRARDTAQSDAEIGLFSEVVVNCAP